MTHSRSSRSGQTIRHRRRTLSARQIEQFRDAMEQATTAIYATYRQIFEVCESVAASMEKRAAVLSQIACETQRRKAESLLEAFKTAHSRGVAETIHRESLHGTQE